MSGFDLGSILRSGLQNAIDSELGGNPPPPAPGNTPNRNESQNTTSVSPSGKTTNAPAGQIPQSTVAGVSTNTMLIVGGALVGVVVLVIALRK